jgi:signal transduction histidine kinase
MGGLEVNDNGEPSAVISVTDTGVGIPTKDQSKIFTKLYRADNVKLLQAGGTGLGLYATKAIVEMMGGKIWFKSEENKGTTFYVSVPVAGTTKKEGEVLQQKKNFDDILKSSA